MIQDPRPDVAQGGIAVDVRADLVALNQAADHLDAGQAVARDQVAGAGLGPANQIAARLGPHAVAQVAHGDQARRVGADEVALDDDPRAVLVVDAVTGVAGDHIAGAGSGPADRVLRIEEVDPIPRVSERGRAVGADADVVALDRVARAVDVDAVPPVARDHIARRGRCAADHVVRGTHDRNAVLEVPGGLVARQVGADVIPLDVIAAPSRDEDSQREPIDHQPAYGAAAGEAEPHFIARLAAVQLDDRYARVSGLGGAVDDRGVVDRRQGRERLDRVRPRPGDGEIDRVEPRQDRSRR